MKHILYKNYFFFFFLLIIFCTFIQNVASYSDDNYMWENIPARSANRTILVKEAFTRAATIANHLFMPEVTPIVVAYAIFEKTTGISSSALKLAGGNLKKFRICLKNLVQKSTPVSEFEPIAYFDDEADFKIIKPLLQEPEAKPSKDLLKTFTITMHVRKEAKMPYLEIGHLVTGITKTSSIAKCLKEHGGTTSTKLLHGFKEQSKTAISDKPRVVSSLDTYGRDLTKLASNGQLPKVVGRDAQIRIVMEVLALKNKANPLLVGDPGVGKTSIVEALAVMIASQTGVPRNLLGKNIIEIDLIGLMGGTHYRGDYEKRIKELLDDALAAKNVILFIDEIHLILGPEKGDGGMDTANMLKPILARGELSIIGATTTLDVQVFEKDSALNRRFQRINVPEATDEATITILRGLKMSYESFHQIRITDGAILAATYLSKRYMKDKYLPDKAIELLDKACSNLRVQLESKPSVIDDLEKDILLLTSEIESLKFEKDRNSLTLVKNLTSQVADKTESLKEHNLLYDVEKRRRNTLSTLKTKIQDSEISMEKAQKLNDRALYNKHKNVIMPELLRELAILETELDATRNSLFVADEVDVNQIGDIIARFTGIPVSKLTSEEKTKLIHLGDDLKKHVVGQDISIQNVARSILNNRMGIKPADKPIGSFLFLGPTGVGKTELAKAVARELFYNEDLITRFDMSEYNHPDSINRLLGSAPGFVGHSEGGQLTSALRKHPYSVVLFDEIEKAHVKVYNILLQVFDGGRLTDGIGRVVDCSNSIFILTSNLGAEFLKYDVFERSNYMDTNNQFKAHEFLLSITTAKKKAEAKVRKHFSPEFFNRLDGIEVFSPLTKSILFDIIKIEAKKFSAMLEKKHITIEFNDPALHMIIDASFSPDDGARPIGRYLVREIGSQIAGLMVRDIVKINTYIEVIVAKDVRNLSKDEKNIDDSTNQVINELYIGDIGFNICEKDEFNNCADSTLDTHNFRVYKEI